MLSETIIFMLTVVIKVELINSNLNFKSQPSLYAESFSTNFKMKKKKFKNCVKN